ncbi:hypothetical protein J2128_001534 [Methanomicrobium sp. W14]|uniref:hypothetical protein n=1 Tax=Methanomicrobium sp. W14 TaxID=2817839 RepID=UPI001AE77397|nr:hypothetical protein [Methanomicrobium sp. W14]MBP2133580.1 hypothetical protein [Methanomicrobium sp. W14]
MTEQEKALTVACIALAVIIIIFSALIFLCGEIPVFAPDSQNPGNYEITGNFSANPGIACDITGYTNVIEERYNTSLPIPGYITEKYGEIYIPYGVTTCDLVEFKDFGLKEDNSTVLPVRIKDKKYSVNLIFNGNEIRNETKRSLDYYSGLIDDDSYPGEKILSLGYSRDLTNENFDYFIFSVNFQSESANNYGIYIKPVQSTKAAKNSSGILYAVYSSDDIYYDPMLPVP